MRDRDGRHRVPPETEPQRDFHIAARGATEKCETSYPLGIGGCERYPKEATHRVGDHIDHLVPQGVGDFPDPLGCGSPETVHFSIVEPRGSAKAGPVGYHDSAAEHSGYGSPDRAIGEAA
jgi:hypothetical protein